MLTGTNDYEGTTEIASGILEARDGQGLPSGSNLVLSGGILQGHPVAPDTDLLFTRSVGTGSGAIQWTGSGGFSAREARLVVNLGGAASTVTWNSGNFIPSCGELLFGSAWADNEVEFQNGIDLNGAARTIRVNAGAGGDSARISGALSGTGRSGLIKLGAGTLVLDTLGGPGNTYSGGTTVAAGALVLAYANALPVNGNLAVSGGATVYEDGDLGNAVQVGGLSLGSTGTFNLSSGKLIVDGAVTSEAAVRAYLVAGRHGGNWAGTGITSSWANANSVKYAVGYMKNSDLGSELAYTVGTDPGAPATWFGRSATMDSVFVRLTYAGDADLSGEVSTDDFDKWKYSYAESLSATWYHGDFDYSGHIDTDDFDLWKYAYSFSYPALDPPAGSAVPEPSALALLLLGAVGAWFAWARRQ